MTAAALTLLAVSLAALVVVAARASARQRRTRDRIGAALAALSPEASATPSGVDEALTQLDRAVEGAVARDRAEDREKLRMAEALRVIGDGIVLFDRHGTAVFENERARAYLGGRHGEAIVDSAIESMARAALQGDAGTETVELFGPPRRVLVLSARPLDRAGALVVIRDETERRRIDDVRRDFVANISHELKTPVGGLSVLAETLRTELDADDADPAVLSRLAGRMYQESARASRTIDDLLQLTEVEASGAERFEMVRLADVVDEAAARAAHAAEHDGVALDVETDRAITVTGDRRQLGSAVYNLVENAVKYSAQGTAVRVVVDRHEGGARLRVIDAGIGIPRRDLDRIFERFYRVDQARSRGTGGTGLGLSIVRHVAVNHGGSVQVDSREGEGSTFELRLPIQITDPHGSSAPASQSTGSERPNRGAPAIEPDRSAEDPIAPSVG